MAIVATYGPTNNGIVPAYRPILIQAQDDGTSVVNSTTGATGIPPEVYCDIYFFGQYYRTISTNVPFSLLSGDASLWQFDISGIVQGFIQTLVYDVTSETLAEVYGVDYQYGQAYCWCRIRISSVDSYGVLTPDGPVPVQGSYNVPPVAGGGYLTDQSFWILNATLQITDNQNLQNMLADFQVTGTFNSLSDAVSEEYYGYQLSYKTKDHTYANDYGLMPLLTCYNAFAGGSTKSVAIAIIGYSAAGTVVYGNILSSVTMQSGFIYTLPTGLINIVGMFPGIVSHLPNIAYYQVGLRNPINTVDYYYISPKIYIIPGDGVIPGIPYMFPANQLPNIAGYLSAPKHTRIWYKNYLGQFDHINFVEREEQVKVTSSPYETPVTAVPQNYNYRLNHYNLSNQSRARNNVRSSETNMVTGLFNENDLPLIKQLFSTSQAFIEASDIEIVGSDAALNGALLPIVISDDSYTTQVFDDRHQYRVAVKYYPSNENIIVR